MEDPTAPESTPAYAQALPAARGYQSSFPVRPGTVVTLSNIPNDLTSEEAERLAQFVRLLGVVRNASVVAAGPQDRA